MNKTLAIDPSSDGTTGYFLFNEKERATSFEETKSTVLLEQMKCLNDLVRNYKPTNIIYESTNYVSYGGSGMTSLFKLFGAIESLVFAFDFIKKIETIPVNQIKGLRKRIIDGKERIEELDYKVGRG